jgi:hypothetical protein
MSEDERPTMIDPSEKLDTEAVVRDPADYFPAPMDVVNDSRFTHDEKRRILESWGLELNSDQRLKLRTRQARTDRGCRRSIWHC